MQFDAQSEYPLGHVAKSYGRAYFTLEFEWLLGLEGDRQGVFQREVSSSKTQILRGFYVQ